MKDSGYQIFWFIGLVLLQVVFFNHINLAYIINPFIYIYLILVFPNSQSRSLSVIIAFLLGISVDALSGTWGIHTVASTLLGYIQPLIFHLVAKPEQLEKQRPSLLNMNGDFFRYAAALILIHHFLLFILEAFDFSLILWVLVKTAVSSLLTFLFVLVVEIVRKRSKS